MKKNRPFFLSLALLFLVGVTGGIYLFSRGRIPLPTLPKSTPSTKIEIKQFTSNKEFNAYLQATRQLDEDFSTSTMDLKISEGRATPSAERISETNVQVKGIDEPDIVKTDGRSIFFSPQSDRYLFRGLPEPAIFEETERISNDFYPPQPPTPQTKIIAAFPPADLAESSTLNSSGELLLTNNTLVVFSDNEILGFDVSDTKNPSQSWNLELENRSQIVTSRLKDNKIYFVTQSQLDNTPCPMPLIGGTSPITIPCTEIYHPTTEIPVDSTFTAFILNPQNGQIENKITFVGKSGTSLAYMSDNSLYLTYTYNKSMFNYLIDFLKQNSQDIFSQETVTKLNQLQNLDISDQAKMAEFQVLIENFYASLTDDLRLKAENEFSNRLDQYSREHARDLEKTGIIKIDINNFKVSANGEVPGRPLNQFSLDEYQNHLRIAATVGSNSFGSSGSANDVYVLNNKLQQTGQVLNLGPGERIYSVRFLEDKGYVVTFKQTDPFYVLDLADPAKPAVKGELKIPGFSSYLHPISKNQILGVGQENSRLKISLFDVRSPDSPREQSKYLLDENWSDIQNTHHAFLLDDKFKVFFLPGSKGGYIFSYQNNELRLKRAVSSLGTRRAIFLDDYLYLIADQEITVLNEADWTEVNRLGLN